MDDSENIAARYLYNPFGKLIGQWGTMAGVNEMQFSSMPRHNLSGMALYSFRAYEPNLQRWLNQDPIQERGGLNLYRFVDNIPVNKVDPLGLQPPQVIAIEILDSPEAQELEDVAAKDAEAGVQATATDIQSLMQKARELYPKLCNIFQKHHNTPKYLGGDPNGPMTLLEAPYHQLITNAFRKLAPYGEEIPDSQSVQNIVNQVYSQYPLPK